jgi:hypothetical protein
MRGSTTFVPFLVLVATGCLRQVAELVGDAAFDAGPGPDACRAAGGNCIIGPALNCDGFVLTKYDCNPDRNPGGAVCCLAGDAGAISDSGAEEDAGPPICHISVEPSKLDFGQVTPGVTAPPQEVSITNTGTADCIVKGVSIAGTGPEFVLQSGVIVSQLLSPVGGGAYPSSLLVQVAFAPLAIASYVGALMFEAGDPNGVLNNETVTLIGEGSVALKSCFVVPSGASFPTVGMSNGQFCSTGKRSVVAVNGCPFSVTVESATIVPAESPFRVIDPSFPLVVDPTAGPPFLIGFDGTASPGTYFATLAIQTDLQTDPYVVALQGTIWTPPTYTDTFTGQALFLNRQFPLSATPVASSIAVSLNGTALSGGDWSYDDLANTVVLGSDVTLQSSDILSISYWLSCG